MTPELGRRVAFTVGALLVYRLGTYIPVPGIDPTALAQLFGTQGSGGLLGMVNLFSGGAVGRVAIFALNLTPLISAAIIVQLLVITVPRLKALRRSGEAGRDRINQYTRYFAIALAAFQAYGIASALEGVRGLVVDPGSMFRLSTVVTLTGGVVFLIWLSDQITARGLGNGVALFLALGIVMGIPEGIRGLLELVRQGALSPDVVLGVAVVTLALTALIAVMEGAQRRLFVEIPPRQVGARTIGGRAALRYKLNGAGIIPATLATWGLLLPLLIIRLSTDQLGWWRAIADEIDERGRLYLTCLALLIVGCALIYTALIFSPDAAADDLQKYGATIPGIEPGEATAAHIDHVLSRVSLLGAAYLALVYLVPELLITYAQVPFYLGGASLLIVVCTVLDLQKQVRGYATMKSGG
jgi:preprotein translocase subunit SecY